MEFLKRPWRGEEKLWKVFWLYGVVGGILINLVVGLALGEGIIGLLVQLPFTIWIMVSEWRCAWNAGAKFWGYIVRVLVILSVIGYLFMMVAVTGLMALGGALSSFKVNGAPTTSSPVTPSAPSAPNALPVSPAEAPPATAAPTTSNAAPAVAAPTASPAQAACEKRMADYAIANHGDPKAYIAQNQAWLQQCIASGGK